MRGFQRLVLGGAGALSALALPALSRAQEPQASPPPATPTTPATPATAPPVDPGAQDLERRYQELLQRQSATEQRLQLLEHAQPAQPPAPLAPAAPLAGYSDKSFFLRDANDTFVLIPKGRLNVDTYTFLNRGATPAGPTNGSADTRPKNTVFLRRARFGVAGTFAKVIDFRFEAELASLPTPGQYATVTDASIIYNSNPYLKFELGQTYAPFALENQTSENYTDFLERSASVRFAVPQTRDTGAMIFGEAPHNLVRYHVGVFNGDGQNFKNLDNHPAYIGRVTVSPLGALPAPHAAWLDEIWVGGSFWHQTATNIGGAVAPSTSGATQGDLSSVTTQSGLSIFSSSYGNGVDANGNAVRSHLAPDGTTDKFALELNVPLTERYGVRGEYLHQSIELREYQDSSNMGTLARARGSRGKFVGSGGYAEVYAWLGGDIHADHPGLYSSPHWKGYKPAPAAEWSVLLAAKYEHIGFDVEDLPAATNASGKAVADAGVGHYGLDVYELGASLWYTRHSRVAANYVLNYLGSTPVKTKNLFYKKSENELLFRWAVSF